MSNVGEVTLKETVVKFMGRTYSAVATGGENGNQGGTGEVSITDTTDITRHIPLGTARSRDEHGAWQIITVRDECVMTTIDLLSAVAALRESTDLAFGYNRRAHGRADSRAGSRMPGQPRSA